MITVKIYCTLLLAGVMTFALTAATSIPFRIFKNLIVVQASVNGQTGNFVMDTGIPSLVLNARYFEDQAATAPDCMSFNSINGCSISCIGDFVRLRFDELSIWGYASVVDLQPLEQQKKMNILGLIGSQALRSYEITIDFVAGEILLDKQNNKDSRKGPKELPAPLEILSFRLVKHLPCIVARLDDQELLLGIDTGAELNIMAPQTRENYSYRIAEIESKTLVALNGTNNQILSGSVVGLQVGGTALPAMQTLFMPLDHLNQLSRLDLDGLLGLEFLKHFRVSFNFKKKEIRLWEKSDLTKQAIAAGKMEGNNR